jgi:hypothetical protein
VPIVPRAPTLGVLITYHNEGELLRECLASVLAMEAGPDEILVYDDASSLPAEGFVPADSRIQLIRGERNEGPGYGRNELLRRSTSDYVHFHDADDLFARDWASAVREEIARSRAEIVLTEIVSVRDGSTVSNAVLGLAACVPGTDLADFALRGALLLPSTTFRRELGLRIGGFRTRSVLAQSEDFDFHVRLAAAARRWTAIPRPLIVQRLRAGSHSRDTVACWTSASAAIELLSGQLPLQYRQGLSDAAGRVAAKLFDLGADAEALHACRVARRLGSPRFADRPLGYRMLAAVTGQATAERAGRLYRRLMPDGVRRALRRAEPTTPR